MQRTRYAELVGTIVVQADGRTLGRVADLIAERRGEALCVTGLLIGPGALLRRIAFRRSPFGGAPLAQFVPWEQVARVDRQIHLREEPRPATQQRDGEQ